MKNGFVQEDERAMRAALAAASRGPRGANPLVGASLVGGDGAVIEVDHHRGSGTAHAEASLLARAHESGLNMRGAHLFVTLEPCNHTGKTGPCSDAILNSGIRSVTYAESDTTSNAAGGGAALEAAGIRVRGGCLAQEAHELNARWWNAVEEGRPFVTAKIASTIDGCVAAADGTSKWITGEAARAHGHQLRQRVDAIVIGTGTALADDPQLTARLPDHSLAERQPLRVVLGQTPIPDTAILGKQPGTLQLKTRSPTQALETLAERGIRHVLLEGGPKVISSFISEGIVDEIYWYSAPKLAGQGISATGGIMVNTLEDAIPLFIDAAGSELDGTNQGIGLLGEDIVTHYKF